MSALTMKYMFIVQLLILLALIAASRKKYVNEINLIGEKQPILKILVPAGLLLLKIIRHKYNSEYERKLEAKIRQISSNVHSHTMLRVHIAKKAIILFLCALFITFGGWQGGITVEYLVFAALLIILVFYFSDKQIDKKLKQRKEEIQREFPEFLNKLIILVNAGLTVSSAIYKSIKDSKGAGELYKELNRTLNDIAAGKPELQSYEAFAARCGLPEISMFVAVLVQNLRKGNSELVPMLRIQVLTCWENRKNAAKKLGEEASAKLLIPMVMIFIAILAMVMAPAIMQFNIY